MKSKSGYLPVFLDMKGARALVVGAGPVAARKIDGLLSVGAAVTVVAREFSPAVLSLAAGGDLSAVRGDYRSDLMEGMDLVFAASSDRSLNARVSRDARRRRIPVNAADSPADCTFILPAVVRGKEFTAAISTGGKNPGAARALREFLEEHREEVSVRLERGRRRKAATARKGKVYIVGAGPGDPDLLTVRALGLIRSADAVVYDYLVPEEILSLAPRKAAKVCFARRGRTAGHGAALKQAAIHEAMARLAGEGKSVVRLKSGDPLVFGRGGEEAEYLAEEGVPFEIVPGVTAAAGCAAAANLPLTHRGRSSSVTFLAGHDSRDNGGRSCGWDRLPQDGTLAIYMGVAEIESVARGLRAAGFEGDTAFAIVENGTRPEQRVLRGALKDLPRLASEAEVRSPAVLFVGRTAAPCAAGSGSIGAAAGEEPSLKTACRGSR